MKRIFSFHLTTYGPLLYRKYDIYKLNAIQIRFSSNRLLVQLHINSKNKLFRSSWTQYHAYNNNNNNNKILEKNHDPFNAKPLLPSILIIHNRR